MAEPAIHPDERKRGVDRIVNFSDAVVAIAATLLVLPLVDITSELDHESVGTLLSENSDKFVAFVLSFVVICRFWQAHHATFEYVVDYTQTLVSVNCLWLLCVAFLPFPTELIGASSSKNRVTLALYIGTMLVTSAVGAWTAWIISRTSKIHSDRMPDDGVASTLVTPITLAVALILAVTIPGIGPWPLLLLYPAGIVEKRLAHRHR
ncbi:MAG TPA: TMEM175 family protein [Micromonosporaceae bacterium]